MKRVFLAVALGAAMMALLGGGVVAAYAISPDNVTICHLEPDGGGGAQLIEMIIPEAALAAHLAHGDTLGPCFESTTVTVTESGSTQTVTSPATTVTVTEPAVTINPNTGPTGTGTTSTVTVAGQTVTAPGETQTVTQANSAAPAVTVAGPTTTVTQTVTGPTRTVTVTKQRIIVKTKPCTCPRSLVPVWKKGKWMGCAAKGKG